MTEMPSKLLADGAAELGIVLDDTQLGRFSSYLSELQSWNQRFNLTSITDEREIVVKHFLDSIAPLSVFDLPVGCSVVDIGAGAGFPGLPLKIVRPDIELVLVESSHKKAQFLEHVSSLLGLEGVRVAAERAEDFGRDPKNRENFCLVVSRAVADIVILIEYALPLLRVGGHLISYKAKSAIDEAREAENALKILGGRIEEVAKVVVPFLNAERYLVSITKVATSPQQYPRKAGIPTKRPLR